MKTIRSRTPEARRARRIVREYLQLSTIANAPEARFGSTDELAQIEARNRAWKIEQTKLDAALKTLARSAK